MVDMMEDVIQRGTAARVRGLGFRAPAAGKTGTSRDGWFAGFTTELLCVVWVGFDDNRDLGLEGAKAALPIWTEFMKRAHQMRGYDHPRQFPVPKGLVRVAVDPDSGMLAGPDCEAVTEYFISGTQPTSYCAHEVDEITGDQIGVADRSAPGTTARRDLFPQP
jgi:penicillin-binding protein 1B